MHTRSRSFGNMNQFKPFVDERDNLGRLLGHKDPVGRRPINHQFSRKNLVRVLREASKDKTPNFEKTESPINKSVKSKIKTYFFRRCFNSKNLHFCNF